MSFEHEAIFSETAPTATPDAPAPADGSHELAVLRSLRRILRAIELHSRELAGACGLTGPQLTVLRAALDAESPTPGGLAREVHLSPATVTGILDRLEARGLVHRRRDALDRRRVVVEVLDEGRRVAAAAPSLLQDRLRRRLAALQEWEQLSLLSALQRVAALMEAGTLEADLHLDASHALPAALETAAPETTTPETTAPETTAPETTAPTADAARGPTDPDPRPDPKPARP